MVWTSRNLRILYALINNFDLKEKNIGSRCYELVIYILKKGDENIAGRHAEGNCYFGRRMFLVPGTCL